MKTYITISLLLLSTIIFAQQPLDTIYANDQKNVALFFPNPIRQGITGTDNFVFSYNQEKEQYFALLQAKPGAVSNLLTITNDGKIYSYILKYSPRLLKFNYFISKNESIGNEKPSIIPLKKKVVTNVDPKKADYFKRFSAHLLKSNNGNIATKRKQGLKLQLQKVVYNSDEIYLVMKITNRSGIDFEIDFLNIYRTNGNNKKKASYQRLEQEIIQKHKMPSMVKNKQSKRIVYVLPKFVLGDNEKLEIELKELKGSRVVVLSTKL
ncbi:DUF4138 domain-containing protein [Flavivirga jejuensis]|uniref:DUF4138 domain-containing protein n=1 Tax=Flavivirga jejuensis TaxID=870487 RepID=A0ABT8WV79_9FLAO|nr:DUF4138 domain-containing protein [Flavivirga jejuensis]MDO5977101.1 DUF4138 domain-containing protein [Flavivirga jejuensis]